MIDFDARQHLEGQDLLAAEQEGRLVVLPCRIGDTVYTIEEDFFDCESCPFGNEANHYDNVNISGCYFPEGRHCPWRIKENVVAGYNVGSALSAPGKWGCEGLEEFSGVDGKWYLTRAEAEAALGGGGTGGKVI